MQYECNFEYYSPKWLIEMFGPFDYDGCTTEALARVHGFKEFSTIKTNGLLRDWTIFEKIWLNPPFYLALPFLEKAVSTYHQAGNEIYFLTPISLLTTKRFHEIIDGVGLKLYIPNGKIKFNRIHQDTEETPSFYSVIFKIQSENEIKFFDIFVSGGGPYILNETE